MSPYAEIVRVLEADGPVPLADVRRWIDSGDLLAWSALYALLDGGASRIEPEAGQEAVDLMRRYLLRCLEQNPAPGEFLHGGFEAAWELASLLEAWQRRGEPAANAIRSVAADLETLYRRGDHATRNRVLCGVLEHVFEDRSLRAHFTNWDRDPSLRDAYRLALEWGAAHER